MNLASATLFEAPSRFVSSSLPCSPSAIHPPADDAVFRELCVKLRELCVKALANPATNYKCEISFSKANRSSTSARVARASRSGPNASTAYDPITLP